MSKELFFEDLARQKLLKGATLATNACKVTLGPKGGNVLLEKPGMSPKLTKDGVEVIRQVSLPDPVENMGARLLSDISLKTAELAGDGTTTAAILGQKVFELGIKALQEGHEGVDAGQLREGITLAANQVANYIEQVAKPILNDKDIINVGTVSANGDKSVGEMFTKAFKEVGQRGAVTVEEGTGTSDVLTIENGFKLDTGYISPHFLANPNRFCGEYSSPYLLVFKEKLFNVRKILPILEQVVKTGGSIIVVANGFDQEVISTLGTNAARGAINMCLINLVTEEFSRATGIIDDLAADLALLSGLNSAKVTSEESLLRLTLEDLGVLEKVKVFKTRTILMATSDRQSAIKEVTETTEAFVKNEEKERPDSIELIQAKARLRRLNGGVATIKVGDITDLAIKERKMRVEDALYATQGALESGTVPGGGVVLLQAKMALNALKSVLPGVEKGIRVFQEALSEPFSVLMKNAGKDPEEVFQSLLDVPGTNVLDLRTNQIGDAYTLGILDPAKVALSAVAHAASIAGLLLTTKVTINELREKRKED